MNAPTPGWFWTLASEMAAQAQHPAYRLYEQLKQDFTRFNDEVEGSHEDYQRGIQRLAKLCGV